MKLSVVIPVYNEKNTLSEIVERVRAVGIDKEIILVDDASSDGTSAIVKSLSDRFPEVKAFTHVQNMGKGAALRTGFAQANGDYVIVQDADLEYDPEDFPKLLQPVLNGHKRVVYGSRFKGRRKSEVYKVGNMHLLHLIANKFLTRLTNLLYGTHLTDMETCYKLLPIELVRNIRIESDRFNFEPEITAKILKSGYEIVEVPISYRGRQVSEGKKIGPADGIQAIVALIKYRFSS